MFDLREFRDALGRFATGVTIVTATDARGTPVGVTVSSYNSVSLDPPLVLWSLAKTSGSLAAFEQSKAFVIHVLGRDQQDLARHFAKSGGNKFVDLDYGQAHGGVPLLPDCAAHFECETAYQYEGGDHAIFVGRVVKFEKSDTAPLVFHEGKFKEVRHRAAALPESSKPHGRFVDDFIPYLIGRAHMQLDYPIREHCDELGMSQSHYMTMGLLSMIGPSTADDVMRRIGYVAGPPSAGTLTEMAERGWLEDRGEGKWHLSAAGRELYLSVLTRSRAMEEELLAAFDPDFVDEGKAFLRMIIDKTCSWLPPEIEPA